ncbi:MAG TPA: hypothetical protein VL463_24690 [Kofleriaceae bacterium]|jgi:hypothetical protein|nr:hypothetical protein [Kofleriaceae bacterium]
MLGALGAIAIESRASRAEDLESRARHASWIAGEALAACGLWVRAIDGSAAGSIICVAEADAPRVLAVLAAAPALPVADALPWSVRTVLRVLGVPMIDAPIPGVRALVAGDGFDATNAHVIEEPTGYRVVFTPRA